MLGLNSLAWLALLVWIGVPILSVLVAVLVLRHSKSASRKSLALASAFVILSVPALISNGVKAYYDSQVRELCAKDGGVRVYEKVRMPAEKFDKYGQIRIPTKQDAKLGDLYYYESSVHYLKNGNPKLWKLRFKVYRTSDNELLGEAISYARRGGDMPGPWHESSFGCPERADITNLKKQMFIKH